MNTVLDLIGEFGLLNDAKGIWGEKFPPESERRWRELKDFYDLLMSKSGIGPRPVTRRFTAKEVEEKVTARERLRVPLENEMIFRAGSEFHAAMGVNLSRGGVFLTSPVILPIHTKLNVYLSYLFTADARVGAGQKRPPRLSYSACSGPGGSRFANWANGLNGLRASWVD